MAQPKTTSDIASQLGAGTTPSSNQSWYSTGQTLPNPDDQGPLFNIVRGASNVARGLGFNNWMDLAGSVYAGNQMLSQPMTSINHPSIGIGPFGINLSSQQQQPQSQTQADVQKWSNVVNKNPFISADRFKQMSEGGDTAVERAANMAGRSSGELASQLTMAAIPGAGLLPRMALGAAGAVGHDIASQPLNTTVDMNREIVPAALGAITAGVAPTVEKGIAKVFGRAAFGKAGSQIPEMIQASGQSFTDSVAMNQALGNSKQALLSEGQPVTYTSLFGPDGLVQNSLKGLQGTELAGGTKAAKVIQNTAQNVITDYYVGNGMATTANQALRLAETQGVPLNVADTIVSHVGAELGNAGRTGGLDATSETFLKGMYGGLKDLVKKNISDPQKYDKLLELRSAAMKLSPSDPSQKAEQAILYSMIFPSFAKRLLVGSALETPSISAGFMNALSGPITQNVINPLAAVAGPAGLMNLMAPSPSSGFVPEKTPGIDNVLPPSPDFVPDTQTK